MLYHSNRESEQHRGRSLNNTTTYLLALFNPIINFKEKFFLKKIFWFRLFFKVQYNHRMKSYTGISMIVKTTELYLKCITLSRSKTSYTTTYLVGSYIYKLECVHS